MGARLDVALAAPASAAERFERLVETIARASRDFPHFPTLVLREVASGGANLPEEVLVRIAHVFAAFFNVLERGRKEGAFRRANPLLTHFLVGGSLVFLSASGPLRKRLAETAHVAPPPLPKPEELAQEVSRLLLFGLSTQPWQTAT